MLKNAIIGDEEEQDNVAWIIYHIIGDDPDSPNTHAGVMIIGWSSSFSKALELLYTAVGLEDRIYLDPGDSSKNQKVYRVKDDTRHYFEMTRMWENESHWNPYQWKELLNDLYPSD